MSVETHDRVFSWILWTLAKEGLVKGKTVGVDATTLEANAAMRSIVRRDTGEGYGAFLTRLAKASGIETPTREDLAKLDRKRPKKGSNKESREDLAKLDRKRPKKGSNKEWEHPHDPDAAITKMKDTRMHLAHKAGHAYDTGGMGRLHLRHRSNILKRLLVHIGAFNLGLVMRKLFGKGTPRGLREILLSWTGVQRTTASRPAHLEIISAA